VKRLAAVVAGLVLSFLGVGAPGPTAAQEVSAAGITSYRFDNGFRVILAPFPSASTVRVELLVKTGSKLEGYGETGMAHLLEHMLFKGAGQRANLKDDLTALGATWNGTTTPDRTNYFATLAADDDKLDELLRIEADRFLRPRFTAEDLASEMTVVRNELERSDTQPFSLVMRTLLRQSYVWHGYGRPTIGARSDIEQAPFSALQAFHRRHYRPDNAALIVSGRFDAARVLARTRDLFGAARNPDAPPVRAWTREEPRASTQRSELVLPAGLTLVASAWKLPPRATPEAVAFDLAAAALCDPDWGSLRKALVIERRLAVSASCYVRLDADYGLLVATARADKDADAEQLSRELSRHVETAASRGIDAAELERARLEELNGYERLRSSHEAIASQLSQAEVAGDWRLFLWQRDTVRALTLAQANQALRTWAVTPNRSDVLLRHADGIRPPDFPPPPAVAALVDGKDWPVLATQADPTPDSAAAAARAVQTFDLDGPSARAALMSRRTQGGLAWLRFENDHGDRDSLAGRQVACDLAGRLMAQGGAGLTRDQLRARLETLQAQWSLSLQGFAIEAPREQIGPAFRVLLNAWSQPLLPVAEFERLKAAALADLEAARRNPSSVAATAVALRFDNYPEGHPHRPRDLDTQWRETQAVSFEDVQRCVQDFLGRSQVRLSVVGDFTPDDVRAFWERVARLPRARLPYARIADPQAPTRVDVTPVVVAMPEQPNATVTGSAVLAIHTGDPDFAALRVAVRALGGDSNSRIWRRLRETDGLAYGAGASLAGNAFDPRSDLVLHASASSAQSERALQALQQELARALEQGFTDDEIERVKRRWQQERRSLLASERSYVGALSSGLHDGQDYAWVARYDERVAQVSAADATRALRRHVGQAPMVWAIGRGQ
jgi:zinc protease